MWATWTLALPNFSDHAPQSMAGRAADGTLICNAARTAMEP